MGQDSSILYLWQSTQESVNPGKAGRWSGTSNVADLSLVQHNFLTFVLLKPCNKSQYAFLSSNRLLYVPACLTSASHKQRANFASQSPKPTHQFRSLAWYKLFLNLHQSTSSIFFCSLSYQYIQFVLPILPTSLQFKICPSSKCFQFW